MICFIPIIPDITELRLPQQYKVRTEVRHQCQPLLLPQQNHRLARHGSGQRNFRRERRGKCDRTPQRGAGRLRSRRPFQVTGRNRQPRHSGRCRLGTHPLARPGRQRYHQRERPAMDIRPYACFQLRYQYLFGI